jgi:peptide/nickel transport system permease protein
MIRYAVRRLLAAVPVLFLVAIIAFLLMRLIPGDPAIVMLGQEADPQTLASLRRDLGLDRPLPVQFATWLGRAARGDLGRSIRDHRPVVGAVLERLPATAELTALALAIGVSVALPLGIVTALRRGSVVDFLGSVAALTGVSIPNFWMAVLLIFLFAVVLRWLPPSGYVALTQAPAANLQLMIMPSITLGLWLAAAVTRQVRSSVLEVMDLDFIRTARAKGLRQGRVIAAHVLRNALIPVVTTLGLQTGRLMGGAVITETIFAVPGVGRLAVDAIFARDFPMVQGVVLLMAVAVLLSNLLVDLCYAVLDPRISYG